MPMDQVEFEFPDESDNPRKGGAVVRPEDDKVEDKKPEIKVLQESLGSGVAKDYAEYQNLCGVIRGLLTAQREINDLLRQVKDYDDTL